MLKKKIPIVRVNWRSNPQSFSLVFNASPFKSSGMALKHFDDSLIGTRPFFPQKHPIGSPPPSRKRVVTLFPGLPPAAPLTRNIQLIYPWLLGGLCSCASIGSIWEQCREVIYNNHFQWLIILRPNNPKTQFPTAVFIKVTDGQNL